MRSCGAIEASSLSYEKAIMEMMKVTPKKRRSTTQCRSTLTARPILGG